MTTDSGPRTAGGGRVDGRDAVVVLGLILLGGGLAGYDWRLALVVVGAVLVAVGLLGAVRG